MNREAELSAFVEKVNAQMIGRIMKMHQLPDGFGWTVETNTGTVAWGLFVPEFSPTDAAAYQMAAMYMARAA